MGLIIVLLVVAAIAGVLWEVLEIALWIVGVMFVALAGVAVAGYTWIRNRLGRRRGTG